LLLHTHRQHKSFTLALFAERIGESDRFPLAFRSPFPHLFFNAIQGHRFQRRDGGAGRSIGDRRQ
jgi:hypothetical protein